VSLQLYVCEKPSTSSRELRRSRRLLDVLVKVGDGGVRYHHLLQVVLPHVDACYFAVVVGFLFAPQCAGEVVVVYQLLRGSVYVRVDDAALPAVRICCGNCPVENFSVAHSSDVCLLPQSRWIASDGSVRHRRQGAAPFASAPELNCYQVRSGT